MRGTCALCKQVAELQNSHLIPAWAYRRLSKARGQSAPVRISGGSAVQTNVQITQRLLCATCEGYFGRRESHVARLTQPVGDSIKFARKVTRISAPSGRLASCNDRLDADQLAYFAASMFWRASVMRGSYRLGAYEEEFRRYLLGEAAFSSRVALSVGLFDPSIDRTTDLRGWASAPAQKRTSNGWLHGFLMCGLVFRGFVGGSVPHGWAGISIAAPDAKGFVSILTRDECPDFLAAFELLGSATPRGRRLRGE